MLNTGFVTSGEDTFKVLQVPVDELIIGTIAFIVVFFMLAKFVLPGLKKTLDERADKIEGGIKRAEEAEAKAAAALAQYQEQLSTANAEAGSIRTAAQAERQSIIEEARREAAAAAALVTEQANARLVADRAQAKSELSREVGRLAYDLAGKVVGESLTDDARARSVVDRFIAELESAAPKADA
jgi:F-type H+-transporting ATPase subunit b